MSAWWESLTWLERLFAYVAFPATLLLILQTLMLLFGSFLLQLLTFLKKG